ncbi:MAG TPA: acyl-CoA reductase [Bacteroidales bacterium]|nr:acyl-CoA reductase [Bacteroidales bacterium]
MDLKDRIRAFSELGRVLRLTASGEHDTTGETLIRLIENQQFSNAWFTPENVRQAICALGEKLTTSNLEKWTGSYPGLKEITTPLSVAVIMAGNIPLAGFHDMLSVLISGNNLVVKTSSKDPDLIREIINILVRIEEGFSNCVKLADESLTGFDSVIATGSDNSSRYFEYYFGRYPHIIRKNRNSIAILDGSETGDEIEKLGHDVFSYFGLGCRNVSKVYIPDGYDPGNLIRCWERFSGIAGHQKYANNLDYNKAVYLVNRVSFLDGGFLLLKEDKLISSPIGVLFFEHYGNMEKLLDNLGTKMDKIQCIVGRNHTGFGDAQRPDLWDYADNADTLDFLLKKNMSGIL